MGKRTGPPEFPGIRPTESLLAFIMSCRKRRLALCHGLELLFKSLLWASVSSNCGKGGGTVGGGPGGTGLREGGSPPHGLADSIVLSDNLSLFLPCCLAQLLTGSPLLSKSDHLSDNLSYGPSLLPLDLLSFNLSYELEDGSTLGLSGTLSGLSEDRCGGLRVELAGDLVDEPAAFLFSARVADLSFMVVEVSDVSFW